MRSGKAPHKPSCVVQNYKKKIFHQAFPVVKRSIIWDRFWASIFSTQIDEFKKRRIELEAYVPRLLKAFKSVDPSATGWIDLPTFFVALKQIKLMGVQKPEDSTFLHSCAQSLCKDDSTEIKYTQLCQMLVGVENTDKLANKEDWNLFRRSLIGEGRKEGCLRVFFKWCVYQSHVLPTCDSGFATAGMHGHSSRCSKCKMLIPIRMKCRHHIFWSKWQKNSTQKLNTSNFDLFQGLSPLLCVVLSMGKHCRWCIVRMRMEKCRLMKRQRGNRCHWQSAMMVGSRQNYGWDQ